MTSGGQKRTRSERVAALELPPSAWERAWAIVRRGDVLLRTGLCLLTAAVLCIVMRAWHPPFAYRAGQALSHDVVARVSFETSRTVVGEGVDRSQTTSHEAGETLARAGRTLRWEDLQLLRAEHEAALGQRSWGKRLARAAALVTIVLALFALCALYLYHQERRLMVNIKRLSVVLGLVTVTVAVSRWVPTDESQVEIVPLLLFGQTMAIAYRREVALLLAGGVTLIVVLALGHGMGAMMLLMGTMATAVLQLRHVRNRSKLIHVAVFAGLAALLLTVVVAPLDGQPVTRTLFKAAGLNVLWTLSAGFLMLGLLYFIERLFGVITDVSLLEWGDMSRLLMQELVQRAPGTYNHSIIVGSIAEAAADAIGAHGLLVRVGAYYHDIGKMLKPGYFIENQPPNDNRHEGLVPAMSTLVIVAHVKDGAHLARQHRLPEPIVRLIEQHHGTTLVEYFYDRANEQRESDPNGGDVEESSYRYPGPKPQTKEAGVLMLADAAESACRSLVEPAPARIESVVRAMAESRLDDGQFDESGLSLRELRTIEDSVIKSLIANYHGRIKYPDQRTA